MDIDKYFKVLKKISILFDEDNIFWKEAKNKAIYENHWLTEQFIDLKIQLITHTFFTEKNYTHLASILLSSKNKCQKIALVMEDNSILSGMYELLIGVGLGTIIEIKCLPHQKTLLQPIVQILNEDKERIFFVEKISKKCSFYGLYKKEKLSSTAAIYFEKYPYMVYYPKKGIAMIEGNEPNEKLQFLAKHIFSFFGMENLNVSKILVPQGYDMNSLFENFNDYYPLKNHTHYALQYDYQLALIILQKKRYFTNGLITIAENKEILSPIGVLNFEYYNEKPNDLSSQKNDVNYMIKVNNLGENTLQEIEQKNYENSFLNIFSKIYKNETK